MPNEAVQHLLARQGEDGGWGAYAGQSSRTESTALGALALRRARDVATGSEIATDSDVATDSEVGPAADRAAAWLASRQLASGAWPVADDVPGPSWATALAVLALSHVETASTATRAGATWLIGQRGRGSPWWVRVLYFFAPDRRPVELDADLIGWPWVEDTFSWVEPTAYAVLALRRSTGVGERVDDRIREAELMIVDRVCSDGGWNYGNSRVFGEDLWSYPDTTALALLSLRRSGHEALIETGLDALARMTAGEASVLSLGLALLAFRAHDRDDAGLRSRLTDRLLVDPDGETRALAWAALALMETPDPLGIRT